MVLCYFNTLIVTLVLNIAIHVNYDFSHSLSLDCIVKVLTTLVRLALSGVAIGVLIISNNYFPIRSCLMISENCVA